VPSSPQWPVVGGRLSELDNTEPGVVGQEVSRPDRKLGLLEGKIWMADDFNETPQNIIDSFYESDLDEYL